MKSRFAGSSDPRSIGQLAARIDARGSIGERAGPPSNLDLIPADNADSCHSSARASRAEPSLRRRLLRVRSRAGSWDSSASHRRRSIEVGTCGSGPGELGPSAQVLTEAQGGRAGLPDSTHSNLRRSGVGCGRASVRQIPRPTIGETRGGGPTARRRALLRAGSSRLSRIRPPWSESDEFGGCRRRHLPGRRTGPVAAPIGRCYHARSRGAFSSAG